MLDVYKEIHVGISDVGGMINPTAIHHPNTAKTLSDTLNVFNGLGFTSESSLLSIAEDKEELIRLNDLVSNIKQQFDQIQPSLPKELTRCFDVTRIGLKEFVIFINAINGLDSDLWRHRDDIYDNPDIDSLLSKLTESLRTLTPMHHKLMKHFSLHRLPLHAVLIKYRSIITNAGFFRIFSAEWRHARREILALSAEVKPNKKILFSLLPALVAYVEGIEKIDLLNNEEPLLEELYKGIDTPLDRIVNLRSWYRSIRNQYR